MKRCRIPVAEYEKLATQFNPTDFDAEKWIDIIDRSGARYFLFTAKHHDGFSMYRSQVDQYNAIDASHFSVDPVEVSYLRRAENAGLNSAFITLRIRIGIIHMEPATIGIMMNKRRIFVIF